MSIPLNIFHRDDLPLGGFAGLKEHRLVVDRKVGGDSYTFDGLGSFVYLADARFIPKGETRLHPHHELDVISLVVEGRIVHEGSLEHGQDINTNQVLVQRAGGEGFKHNEVNPDDTQNRMIQIWMLPETPNEPASYKFYDLAQGELTRVYGGAKDQNRTMNSHTVMEVGMLNAGQEILKSEEFMAYVTRGDGTLNGVDVREGDLVRGKDITFTASDEVQIILFTTED